MDRQADLKFRRTSKWGGTIAVRAFRAKRDPEWQLVDQEPRERQERPFCRRKLL